MIVFLSFLIIYGFMIQPVSCVNFHNVPFRKSFSWINYSCFQFSGCAFVNASHLKTSSTGQHSVMFAVDGFEKWPVHIQAHTYLRLLTGLTVCPVWLIVQLLGDYTQELGLVFVSIVVRRAYADQLRRHKCRERISNKPQKPLKSL